MDNLPAVVGEIAPQADTDADLVALWIGRHESSYTRRNYQRQAAVLLRFTGKPIASLRVGDVQAYLASLADKASATWANAAAAIKSLLSFAQEVGYTWFNVGKAVKATAIKGTLAERIMTEADAMRMLAFMPVGRNRALLTLLYGGGLRISEACVLRWHDLVGGLTMPRECVKLHGTGHFDATAA